MKQALVTGSTKGIGLAVAEALLARGYFVYLNYARDDASAAALQLDSQRTRILKADLSTQAGLADLLAQLPADADFSLDCLVLNAGLTCRTPFGQVGAEEWETVMNANVTVPFLLVQALRERLAPGASVIFIGSSMGIHPHAVSVAYSVTKAAVHMMAKSLVKVFADQRVRVNAVAPGFVDTEWQKDKPQWLRDKIAGKIALNRFASPDEIADACLFLLDNQYVNGAVLEVDGGYDFE